MKKAVLFLPLLLVACTNPISQGPKPTPVNNIDAQAVTAAKALYDQKYGKLTDQQKETQLVDGPCLANNLLPDWVADIAHQPRTAADNDPKNQCSNYVQGKAHHFVELDEFGNLLREY